MIFCSSGLVLQMIYAVWQMAGTPRFGSKVSGAGDVNCLDVALQISDDRSITWSLFNKPQNLQIYMFQLPVVTSQHL